ncbi:MAG: DUF5056 domain-containing protein [Bacteroides sp.]|nr:DUF5056 domain-containing protein [Bacteroides sp.]
MMVNEDDKLLKQFFTENKQEIVDDGFSRRVMRHLPGRANRLAKLWTLCTFALAVLLFVLLDGIELLWNFLRETFIGMLESGASAQVEPSSLLIAALVLLFLGYRKIASMA